MSCPHVRMSYIHTHISFRAKWEMYWKPPRVEPIDGFHVLEWWEQMGHLVPTFAAIAHGVLAATGCDMERFFSSLKWVKDERQRGMHQHTHGRYPLAF